MKILYIEGFSQGPGLPYPLLANIHNDISIINPKMPYYLYDLIKNPMIILFFIILTYFIYELLNFMYYFNTKFNIVDIGFILLLIFIVYSMKILAFTSVLETCIELYRKEILIHNPDIVIGYSWGGGILTMLIERKYWNGHSILIAPGGTLMNSFTYNNSKQLSIYNYQYNKNKLYLIHGTNDDVIPYNDSINLYKTLIKNDDIPDNVPSDINNIVYNTTHNSKFITAQNHNHMLKRFLDHKLMHEIINEIMETNNETM